MLPIKVMRLRNAAGGGGGGSDPYWANVVSLLHFNGTDGSTTFTDETGKTWTAYGDAQIDTAQSKFGGASGLFDGSSDRVETGDHSDFNFGSGDFTVECWFRESGAGAIRQIVGQHTTQSTTNSSFLILSDNRQLGVGVGLGGSFTSIINTDGQHSLDTWIHVAMVRDGTTLRLFVDGSQKNSTNISTTAVNDSTRPVTIGVVMANSGPDPGNYYYNGYVDELRITKGVARYTSNFTPPSAPFPDS